MPRANCFLYCCRRASDTASDSQHLFLAWRCSNEFLGCDRPPRRNHWRPRYRGRLRLTITRCWIIILSCGRRASDFRPSGRRRTELGGAPGPSRYPGSFVGQRRSADGEKRSWTTTAQAIRPRPPRVSHSWTPSRQEGPATASRPSQVPADHRDGEPAEVPGATSLWIIRLLGLVGYLERSLVVSIVRRGVPTVRLLHAATAAATTGILLASGGRVPSGDPRGWFLNLRCET